MDRYEQRIVEIIDGSRDRIIEFARDLYTHAELGFREFRTSQKFADRMSALGLPMQDGLAITGRKAYLNPEKKDNFSLALLGEMDALRIQKHKYYNPEGEAAHCCGHHAQVTGVVGAALALCDPEIRKLLDGQVIFFAVPAEEYGEIEFKETLRKAGKIRYLGGKPELIAKGAFDDIDLNVAHHLDLDAPWTGNGVSNGFVAKVITYDGKASHAAVAPEKGVNALNAANIGLSAIAMNRETFRDDDHVRVHPIITKGGDLVNVVPSEVRIETFVRAANIEAMDSAAKKTDRCFAAGAMAVGAKVRIETTCGYLPGIGMPAVPELLEAMQMVEPERTVAVKPIDFADYGSSDLGDLQHYRPVVQFRNGGITGGMHQEDFDVVDEEEAYVNAAKMFALFAYRLLKDGAALGKRVASEHRPRFTDKKDYLAYIESYNSEQCFDYTKN